MDFSIITYFFVTEMASQKFSNVPAHIIEKAVQKFFIASKDRIRKRQKHLETMNIEYNFE
jgi:hypothetical protein